MKKNEWMTAVYYYKRQKALQKRAAGNRVPALRFPEKISEFGRKALWFLLLSFLLCLFLVMGIHTLLGKSQYSRLDSNVITSEGFREQRMTSEMLEFIRTQDAPGEALGVYWLETAFSQADFPYSYRQETFQERKRVWEKKENWDAYLEACEAIWNDLKYFPVPEPSNGVPAGVSYVDSWMFERNYGGKRGHEGTDLMASIDERGRYPIVSMTDGVVRHKGWLEKGGYRLGIAAPGGAYFYYAHLDSYADLEEGDPVKAGDLLGFMGDTGYSKVEGTTGNFPVHLHVGIYLILEEEEISFNPYYALRFLEERKIRCAYPAG